MKNSSISLFVTELSAAQLESTGALNEYSDSLTEKPLVDDWQSEFISEIEFSGDIIPWNWLRAKQFNLADEVRTVVCCDPVVMQMTHRGAYLWGQQSLSLSTEEAIQIVAYINEQLMEEGEGFYMLNNNQWLYTNEKKIEIRQPSFEQYVGKDMFGFSYSGSQGMFWQKLATEIQMLVKQMVDYQGISSLPPEHILNVHFWGNSNPVLESEILEVDRSNRLILSDDIHIESLVKQQNIPFGSLIKISTLLESKENELEHISILLSNHKSVDLSSLVDNFIQLANRFDIKEIRIVTTDKILKFSNRTSIWNRIKAVFKTQNNN